MIAIFKREFCSYMNNVIGYAVIAFISLCAGALFTYQNLINASPDPKFAMLPMQLVLIVAVPVLAMRSLSEEKRNRMDRFLYSLPLKLSSIVLGKYLAMLCVLSIACGVVALYPAVLQLLFGLGSPAQTYVSLLGFWLLGAALLAMSLCLSTLAESPVVALLYSVFGILVSLVIGLLPDMLSLDGLLGRALSDLGLFSRYTQMCLGMPDIGTFVFDISITVLFLFLAVMRMEQKRRR
jgi:ABC-2 type transport system permease protein